MPNEESSSQEKLQRLGQRLRRAVAKLHPLTEQEIEKVRAAVGQKPEIETDPEQDLDQDYGEDQGHDRGR